MAALRLASPAFEHDEDLPAAYTAEAGHVSPPLSWSGVPDGTAELAVVAEDPDADAGVITHWIVYGIEPGVTGLPQDLGGGALVETDELSLVQGLNEWDGLGYAGAEFDDERGAHRLFFRLFALDTELDLPPGATRVELRQAARGHLLAQAELVTMI